jgi:glycosyltransferase involved in cell wall biosynthesis
LAKICMLSSVHPALDTRIFHKEAESLARAGYDVTIVGRHERDEVVDGIRIVALAAPRNRIERVTRSAWNAYRMALRVDADLYHYHDPELIPVGFLLRLHGKKTVYDVHEDVPRQLLSKHYLPWIMRQAMSLAASIVEWLAARCVSAIVAATPPIAERFPAAKTITVHNYAIVDELVVARPTPYAERLPAFVYPGVIAEVRGIEEMLRALELLGRDMNVRLDLAGEFVPPEFRQALQALPGWRHVKYHGSVGRKELARLMGDARCGLVLHRPIPNEVDAQPIKLFEYMGAGLPVIASDFRPLRKIIDAEQCGLVVDPSDPEAIAAAMRWVLTHPIEAEAMGRNGRRAVVERYNWEAEGTKLLALYGKILACDSRAT